MVSDFLLSVPREECGSYLEGLDLMKWKFKIPANSVFEKDKFHPFLRFFWKLFFALFRFRSPPVACGALNFPLCQHRPVGKELIAERRDNTRVVY